MGIIKSNLHTIRKNINDNKGESRVLYFHISRAFFAPTLIRSSTVESSAIELNTSSLFSRISSLSFPPASFRPAPPSNRQAFTRNSGDIFSPDILSWRIISWSSSMHVEGETGEDWLDWDVEREELGTGRGGREASNVCATSAARITCQFGIFQKTLRRCTYHRRFEGSIGWDRQSLR